MAEEAQRAQVVIAHDYITQRGGAERVVLEMARAFPGAPIVTSLYSPEMTFPEFAELRVLPLGINRFSGLRRHHRWAVPVLAPAFSRVSLRADLVLCSSSGWAHGLRTTGRKVIYCHAPARWLYQTDRYLGSSDAAAGARARSSQWLGRAVVGSLGPSLRRWDQLSAASASRYLTNSTAMARSIARIYGLRAQVIPPPPAVVQGGTEQAVPGVLPGYWLCVSRLLPYKNVDLAIEGAARAGHHLVIVGDGPDRQRVQRLAAGDSATLLRSVSDAELRWLYANSRGLIACSYEDFGLTPLEAATFGRPTVALRFGGYLDTVVAGETGLLFDELAPDCLAASLEHAAARQWSQETLRRHAATFSAAQFRRHLRAVVRDELSGTPTASV